MKEIQKKEQYHFGTYLLEQENTLTMTEFANKIKTELLTRKIITNKLEVKKISGEWNIIIYDKIKTNKEIYNKKIKDIFGKGMLNGIRE